MRTALLLLLLALPAACGNDTPCGPGDAPDNGLTADLGAGEQLTFGGFTSSANNDCSVAGSPTSLTVDGVQMGQSSFHITFCLPRPDQIGAGAIDLTDDTRVQIININGDLGGGCLLTQNPGGTLSGTISFVGFCKDGGDPAGYAIQLAGTVPGFRACTGGDAGTQSTPVDIALSGTTIVTAL